MKKRKGFKKKKKKKTEILKTGKDNLMYDSESEEEIKKGNKIILKNCVSR